MFRANTPIRNSGNTTRIRAQLRDTVADVREVCPRQIGRTRDERTNKEAAVVLGKIST
jgi:hypothetical protein